MARPLKDGLSYYQHDVDMSQDERLEALEAVHGNDGYAVYNKLLERVYKSAGKLSLADDVQRLTIVRRCNVTPERFMQIVADAVRFGLFDEEPWTSEGRLTSSRIRRQLEIVEAERKAWRGEEKKENPPPDELSPEITPVIQGDNPSYPGRKVHKADKTREDKRRQQPRAREENQPVDNSEELSLQAYALERAKASPGVNNVAAYAAALVASKDFRKAWREHLDNPPPPPAPILPPAEPCSMPGADGSECGGDVERYPGDPPTRKRCTRCRTVYEYNELEERWEVWAPVETPVPG